MKKNRVLEYITEKKYYLSLLGSLLVILIAVGVIYYNGQQYEEIANLNDSIQKEELVDNSIDEMYQEKQDMIEANIPQITIHDEEIITEDMGADEVDLEEKSLEEILSAEEDFFEDERTAQVIEDEKSMIEVVPTIKVQQPKLSFTKKDGMMMPLVGQTIIPYNETVPVYLKTLDQYRINKGMYIGAEVGAEVKAVAEGVIEKINLDANRGNTIVIYHGNGYKTIYAQLKEDVNVKEGDVVEKGKIIGYVNEPTKYYKLEGAHLYFEVLENDISVDPSTVLR